MMNWFRTMCSRMAAWNIIFFLTLRERRAFSKVKMFWKTTTEDEDGEDAQYTLNDFYEVPFN